MAVWRAHLGGLAIMAGVGLLCVTPLLVEALRTSGTPERAH